MLASRALPRRCSAAWAIPRRRGRRSVLGLLEAFGAGYISSAYKDAIAFVVILLVLFVVPQGLFGRARVERV